METSYSERLKAFAPAADEAGVKAEVARMREAAVQNETAEVWRACLGAIDLTSLGVTDSESSVAEFAGRAARLAIDFPHLPLPASVCVWPSFVDTAGLALGNSRIAVTSVAGGFPSSQTFIEVKMLEIAMAIESGADEIDIVLTLGEMMDGEYDRMAGTLELLRGEAGDATLKVIVESGALGTPQLIRDASLLAMLAGADFVKTSTGKIDIAATPEAAIVMCTAIRDFHRATGRRVGFKVAGGVRSAADAALYYTIVERILGPEWLTPALFRIGASGLANSLLSAVEGREITYF
ncbi:MAG: deoxyribose-phosphate aldolase [Alistipes sp.]|jgi:deoxyribose-phosphate aldolase|nr:deoxyribose-phosphate aldolase [Alistipes sp.]